MSGLAGRKLPAPKISIWSFLSRPEIGNIDLQLLGTFDDAEIFRQVFFKALEFGCRENAMTHKKVSAAVNDSADISAVPRFEVITKF